MTTTTAKIWQLIYNKLETVRDMGRKLVTNMKLHMSYRLVYEIEIRGHQNW